MVWLIKITNIDVEKFKSFHLKIIVEIQCIQMQIFLYFVFVKMSLEREWTKGGWRRWLDQGGAVRERLIVAVEGIRQAAKKFSEGPTRN